MSEEVREDEMSEFVVDNLGVAWLRANFESMRARLSPHWRRVLGNGREVTLYRAMDEIIGDAHQRIRDGAIARWADDGGREP